MKKKNIICKVGDIIKTKSSWIYNQNGGIVVLNYNLEAEVTELVKRNEFGKQYVGTLLNEEDIRKVTKQTTSPEPLKSELGEKRYNRILEKRKEYNPNKIYFMESSVIECDNSDDYFENDELYDDGLIVEVSQATINNNVGGTSSLNVPVFARIIKSFDDYEVGYTYHGELFRNEDIEASRKIGTTKYSPEHYKQYGEKMYNSTLKSYEEYNPKIIYFSQYSIVREVSKNEITN